VVELLPRKQESLRKRKGVRGDSRKEERKGGRVNRKLRFQ
jgi:hypothetical protein